MANKNTFHSEYSKLPATAMRARQLGEKYYFTGKPCVKMHFSMRYSSSGNCVQCIADKRGQVEINTSNRSSKRSVENHNRAIAAHDDGLLEYESTNSCPQGHYTRYTASNNCVDCSKLSNHKKLENSRWKRIQKEYGLSEKGFLSMLESQNNLCEICGSELHLKNTHIDHSHKTGKVRSLLCSKCNQAIGLLNENISIIEKAANYLKRHSNET